MKIQNIALIGYMRSGKDSVASCLIKLFNTEKLSFSRALKVEVAEALNRTRRIDDPLYTADFFEEEETRALYRPLLQWWGTEYRRAKHPDHWVDIVRERLTKNRLDNSWVCTDARFTNELTMLRDKGFKTVKLDMDVDELVRYLTAKGMSMRQINEQLDHVTEREWQNFHPDISFPSRFGNLPQLTRHVITYLTGEAPSVEVQEKIDTFYAEKYPKVYREYGKAAVTNDA